MVQVKSIKKHISHYSWDIAYGTYSPGILKNGLKDTKLHIVKNPFSNKWFADPFILEENTESIQFFVEEFDYSVGRGRIARLLVNKKDNRIKECSIILDLPTHLSFPAIYRVDGVVYVHPENSASGASYIYRYDRATDKLVEPRLMVNEPITDAIIRQDESGFRMFATRVPESNGCMLHEYSSKDLFGPYTHKGEETFDLNTARMAGMFIDSEQGLFRPAQDCFRDYGKAVLMYKEHEEICRLTPLSYKYAGIHTFNTSGNTFVIDLKKYDYPILHKLIRIIRK